MLPELRGQDEVGDLKWRVLVPGQPPSVNHTYKPVIFPRKDRSGRTIYDQSGRVVNRIGMAKQKDVVAYQNDVIRLARVSRPSGWEPSGAWIRVRYRFFLKRKVDCDNALKALNDALAMAIGVDDNLFLPCVESKSINGKEKYPRVEVEIEQESDSPSPSPEKSSPSGSSPASTAPSPSSPRTPSSSSGSPG